MPCSQPREKPVNVLYDHCLWGLLVATGDNAYNIRARDREAHALPTRSGSGVRAYALTFGGAAASLPLARCPCGAGASRPQQCRHVLAPSLFFLLPSRTDATASEKRNDCPLRAWVRLVHCTSLRVRPSSCLTPPLLGAQSACPTASAWSILPSLHLARPVGGKVMLWQYPFFM